MTALVNNQESQAPVQTSQNQSGNGVTGSQLSAGAIAFATNLINEIMALYAEIMHLNQEQKVNMVKAQSQAALGQANATLNGGSAQMWMYVGMGIASIATAGAGLIAQAVVTKSPEGQAAKLGQEEAEKELDPLKEMSSVLTESSGPKPQVLGNANDPEDPAVTTRMNDLRNGDFKDTLKTDDESEKALNVKALRAMREDNTTKDLFETKKTQFNKDFDRATQEFNSSINRNNTLMQKITSFKSISEQLVGIGNNGVQAWGNQAQAAYKASESLQGTVGQMAGSSSSDFGGAMTKALDAQNNEVNILNEVLRSNGAGG